jgi:hypothetical protein
MDRSIEPSEEFTRFVAVRIDTEHQAQIQHGIPPGTLYGDRLNQLDLRVGKIVKAGGTRTASNVDLYTALNANPVIAVNGTFNAAPTATPTAAWLGRNRS